MRAHGHHAYRMYRTKPTRGHSGPQPLLRSTRCALVGVVESSLTSSRAAALRAGCARDELLEVEEDVARGPRRGELARQAALNGSPVAPAREAACRPAIGRTSPQGGHPPRPKVRSEDGLATLD
jgi:hypothetical protein